MKHYDVFLSILPFREYPKLEDQLTLYSQMRILYIYKNFFPKEAQSYLDSEAGNLFKTVFTRYCANSELTADLFVMKTTYTTGHSELELTSSSIHPETRRYTKGKSQAVLASEMVIDEITKYAQMLAESTLDLKAKGAWSVYKTAALSYYTELVSEIQMTLIQHLFPDASRLELATAEAELAQKLILRFDSVLQLVTEPVPVKHTKYANVAAKMRLIGEPLRKVQSAMTIKGTKALALLGNLAKPTVRNYFTGSTATASLKSRLEMIYRMPRLLSDLDPFSLSVFDGTLLTDLYSIDRKD